jgi:hypothetical protein
VARIDGFRKNASRRMEQDVMKGVVVVCGSCRQTWRLDVEDSVYLKLNLLTCPCPYCEAYTLRCPSGGSPCREPRARRSPLRPHLAAQSGTG